MLCTKMRIPCCSMQLGNIPLVIQVGTHGQEMCGYSLCSAQHYCKEIALQSSSMCFRNTSRCKSILKPWCADLTDVLRHNCTQNIQHNNAQYNITWRDLHIPSASKVIV